MEWNDISRESYFHNLHFKKGVKAKHSKLCSMLSDHLVDSMIESQKEQSLRSLIKDNLENLCPLDVIESVIELKKEEWIQDCDLSADDFYGE